MSGFIRCDHCGNTYGDAEPWCPHCLAPRPEELSRVRMAELGLRRRQGPHYEARTFYADNTVYTELVWVNEDGCVAPAMPPIERR